MARYPLDAILDGLSPKQIARNVETKHNNFRLQYSLRGNTADNFETYELTIGEYLKLHFENCVAPGGRLELREAIARAKHIIAQAYHRKYRGNISSAYNDAKNGTNGGLKAQLDIIADQLINEAREYHIRQLFDDIVKPNSWDEKVEIIRQFFRHYGDHLDPEIDRNTPERYASNFEELIRAYAESLARTGSFFNSF